jgi:hypothetical protein
VMLGSEIFICAMHNLSDGCFMGASWVLHGCFMGEWLYYYIIVYSSFWRLVVLEVMLLI